MTSDRAGAVPRSYDRALVVNPLLTVSRSWGSIAFMSEASLFHLE